MNRAPRRLLPPWPLVLAAAVIALGVAIPLAYLALEIVSDPEALASLWTPANRARLGRSLLLALGVWATTSLLAFPLAWLSVRSDLRFRRFWSVAVVLPLSIPAYVMAYAALSLGGDDGMLAGLFGLDSVFLTPLTVEDAAGFTHLPRLSGYWGALAVLSLYNLPYVYLPLRSAVADLNPAVEESAMLLGRSRLSVVWPRLMPAYTAGCLLVILHVLADFGAVSLMRYETLSAVLYIKYNTFDTSGAAAVAGLLLLVAGIVIAGEMAVLGRLGMAGQGTVARRATPRTPLGVYQVPATILFAAVFLAGVILPAMTVVFWTLRAAGAIAWGELIASGWNSVRASLPAAAVTTALAIPIAMLSTRYPSRVSTVLERLPFIGYAVPALAFALSLIRLVSDDAMPDVLFDLLYQSMPLLVAAYAIHFLAEAVGPVRSSLYATSRSIEDAGRVLGRASSAIFFLVTLPALRNGIAASAVLVFLSCIKELPLTLLLSPIGFETLAVNVWNYSENVQFARAAPFALAIIFCSALFTAVSLRKRDSSLPIDASD